MINLIFNGTKILISQQQVLSRLNTEYQHIIIMHIDNRYTWKPIREKTTSYYCCDAKASSNSLSPLIFCRLQPTGGYYLNSASYNLQGSSNSHLFLAGYNLQEAPTSASYNWTSIKLQLDMEAPTSSHYNENTCWFTWIWALFYSFFTVVLQPSYLLISSLNLHSFSICSSFFLHSLTSCSSLTFFLLSHPFWRSLTSLFPLILHLLYR